MTQWEILRYTHHIGSPMIGTVIDRGKVWDPNGSLKLSIPSQYQGILPYDFLFDDHSKLSQNLIPDLGRKVDVVVYNFIRDSLYLSAKPSDLSEKSINDWKYFYQYIETIVIGSIVIGKVVCSRPFGLFVDIKEPYVGLIDVAKTRPNFGVQLPDDYLNWPKEGDKVKCYIGSIRLHNKQIGLEWLPDL
jgi:hypothetical protein